VKDLPRLIRFGAVGVVNTGMYYSCYLALHTELPYLVAHTCAFIIAMIISYFLNCAFTYRRSPSWKTFLLFPLSNVANYVITTIGLQIAVGELNVDQRIAPLIVAVIAIPITYVVATAIMVERRHGHHLPAQVDLGGASANKEGPELAQ